MDQMNLIDINEFTTIRKIGSGRFGEIFKIEHKKNRHIYAAKISFNLFEDDSPQMLYEISDEINILSKIHHPSIIKFIGLSFYNFFKEKKPVIITEFFPNGSLYDILSLERQSLADFDWNPTRKLINIYGIASAMSYLHSHQIIHQNLKPKNILIDQFLCPKIDDIGLSRIQHSFENSKSLKFVNNEPAYIAPEIWKNENYTAASDVYSYGIIMYEIMTVQIPFENCDSNTICENVLNGKRPEINKKIPKSYHNLIERCWSQNEKDRPSFDQIINELKRDEKFTESVNLDDFLDYVDYVDNYEKIFQVNKCIIKIDEKIKRESKTFQKIVINKKPLDNQQTGKNIDSKISKNTSNANENLLSKSSTNSKTMFKTQNKETDKNKNDQQKNSTALINNQSNNQANTKNNIHEKEITNCSDKIKSSAELCNNLAEKSENPEKYSNHQKAHRKVSKQIDKNKDIDKNDDNQKKSNSDVVSPSKSKCIDENIISLDSEVKSKPLNQNHSQNNHSNQKIKADKHIKESNLDDSYSLYEKGLKYFKGEGVPVNKSKAAHYFQLSADKGNEASMNCYASMLKNGDGIAENKKEAARYYKMSADNGNVSAMNHYSKMLYNGDGIQVDKKEAAHYFKLSADKGSDSSMSNYAYMLKKGDGIPINKTEAARYYKMSSDKGNDSAMYSYANMLYDGDGIPQNKTEAAHYYKMSADKGNINAINSYANMLHNGDGIPQNKKEASSYYRMLDGKKK